MFKKVFKLIFPIFVFIALVSINVQATNSYSVWVGDQQVTSENMSGQAGSGTWGYEGNATNSTLTLNNATITTSFNPTYANIKSSIPLTINLKGTNTITESENNDAISLPRSGSEPTNTINGPGTLNLTGRTLISNGTGNNNLVINNTTITGKCTGNAIKAGNLTINNSTIRLDEYAVIVESEGDSDESRTTSGNNTDDTSSDNLGSSNGKLGAIKTGDETNTSPSIILILISFVGLTLALIPNKKHGFKPKYYR